MGLSTKQTINSNTTTDTSISISQTQAQCQDDDDDDDHRDAANLDEEDNEEQARAAELAIDEEEEGEGDGEHCVICLHEIRDRTILPCAHDRLCFECIFVWCQQSRKCPLCNAPIGPYLIHNFRSDYDYSKHYLQPLRNSPVPNNVLAPLRRSTARSLRTREPIQWGRRRNAQTSQERKDELELAISKRRWIYRHGLYAKHVASNSHTRYRPSPTPAQFSNSQDAISRATIFIRRELRVWINLDVEFLTTFILSLMKSIDIRSESAVKLLAEFLDMDISYHVGETDGPSRGRFPNAEHFAHELYSYLRSPFKDLTVYDRAVQYEIPSDIPPPPDKPIPKRNEKHWETTTAAAHDPTAESSRHALNRLRRNSHSPHLRSEEEEEEEGEEGPVQQAYSPSQSPSSSNSYDNFYRYRPSRVPSPGGGTGRSRHDPSSSFGKRRVDDDREEEDNKDEKGKGKGKTREMVIPSKRKHATDTRASGTWKSKSKNTRVEERTSRKRERSVSSEEDSTRKRSKSPFRRNVGRAGGYESYQHSPIPPNLTDEGTTTRKKTGTSKQLALSQIEIPAPPPSTKITDQQPEIPVHPNWGISIKGQAKLQLGGGGDMSQQQQQLEPLSDSNRVSPSVGDIVSNLNPNDTISKNRLRKPSELLHAHLLRNSSTTAVRRTLNEVDASNSGGSSSTGSGSGSSSATVQNNYNTNNNTEIGIILKEENERRTSSSSRDLEVAPHAETPDNGLPNTMTTRMSARDIMIRTRARLAKMRNEQDSDVPTAVAVMEEGADDNFAPPPLPSSNTMSELELRPSAPPATAVSLSATVRAHLLKQLEEEKRKLNSRNSGKRDEDAGGRRRRSFDAEAGGGGGMNHKNTASDGHTGGGVSIGKNHQDLITKEEILRARLLSRKSDTREGSGR